MGPLLRPGGPWFVLREPGTFCGALILPAGPDLFFGALIHLAGPDPSRGARVRFAEP